MKTSDRVRARYMSSPVARSAVLAFFGLIGLAAAGQAAKVTWSILPDDRLWSNVNNWEGNVVPHPGDDVVFPGSYVDGNLTNDLVVGIAIRSIRFDFNQYTLGGNAITLDAVLPFTIGCTTALHPPDAPSSNTVSLPIIATGTVLLSTVPGCSLIVAGPISGPGGMTASGVGPVILSSYDSYLGSTSTALEGGFLIINGTLSGTNEVVVQASAGTSKLEGSGTFTAPLSVQSTSADAFVVVAPGQARDTGILSTGSASFGLNASLAVKLNGTVVGTEYDQLNVTGGIALGETTTLHVTSLGFAPAVGAVFTIIKNNTGTPVSGTFVGLPEGSVFVKYTTSFRISYVGGDGHDVVLTVVPTAAAPAALAVDTAGNGVLETGELVTLEPTWTNTSGAPVHLTGATFDFEGPVGPFYDNPDAGGDYGTLAGGASVHCVDCYSIQVTSAFRPTQHWDANIHETVSPGPITKTWELHVGESFPDVPTSEPFYVFIENLFHNGVTGGCAGGNYCPDNPVTRAQMAVFLLKGEHGSDYLPPACSAAVFVDEPCPGGQFVDWVNQLASEGITGGCGGGNYCPGAPVLRGQMAVFLLKGEHGPGYAPAECAETVFGDVPCPGGQFVGWINQLAAEGITGGCGGGNFCPGDPVGRGQMAALLVKAFGLVLYHP